MKAKTFITLFLIVTFLASCTLQMAVPLPIATMTVVPTATAAPTITSTPTPQSLADAPDLSTWVEDYVHAYGGKVTVNGTEMDADQLTAAIRQNPDEFTQKKQVNGIRYLFAVVNNVPLAMRGSDNKWQAATMAQLSGLTNVQFEFGWDETDLQQKTMLKKMFNENTTVISQGDFQMDMIFSGFTQQDWKFVLDKWDTIEKELNNGIIPESLPFTWSSSDKFISEAKETLGNPQFRAEHLLWSNWDSTDTIASVVDGLGFSQADMRKLLEFMVRTRVIKYPQINKWDVTDETDLTDWTATDPEDILWQHHLRYWEEATGTTPVEITALIAQWVKQDNPDAETYVVQDCIFDNVNPEAEWTRNGFEKFVPELVKVKAKVDYFEIENNLWIYAQPDLNYVSKKIDWIRNYGFDVKGSETMIVIGDEPINPSPRRIKINVVKDTLLEQANMYAEWLQLYLDKGIRVFGLGGADDNSAWTNAVGQEDANPLLFDDEFRAKPAYYSMVQVLYQQLP